MIYSCLLVGYCSFVSLAWRQLILLFVANNIAILVFARHMLLGTAHFQRFTAASKREHWVKGRKSISYGIHCGSIQHYNATLFASWMNCCHVITVNGEEDTKREKAQTVCALLCGLDLYLLILFAGEKSVINGHKQG